MLARTWRGFMIVLGGLSLALGAIGVFLPLLPTAPFVLLAAFFFSRGSKRLHLWLREHPRFGIYVRDWEAEQVIPPVGKYASTFMMIPSVGWAIATRDIPPVLSVLMVATVAGVLWFIWTRPSRRSLAAATRPADSERRNRFAFRPSASAQAESTEGTIESARRARPEQRNRFAFRPSASAPVGSGETTTKGARSAGPGDP